MTIFERIKKFREELKYRSLDKLTVLVPKDDFEYRMNMGQHIVVGVSPDAYLAYSFMDDDGDYDGVVVDNLKCDKFKKGDFVKIRMRGINFPSAVL